MANKHEFWSCKVCGAQNHETDGECQYCDCEGMNCKRDNCHGPYHEQLSWLAWFLFGQDELGMWA